MRLSKLGSNLKEMNQQIENERCRVCASSYTNHVWDHETGDVICVDCGTVAPQTILSDTCPRGAAANAHWGGGPSTEFRSLSSGSFSIYVRYFHFNEVLATLTLSGPWINNADFREIKRALKGSGIHAPTRSDIQSICKHLNSQFDVRRFTKKYCEKWIQIVYRYCGRRPPVLHPNVIRDLQRDFRMISQHWPAVEHLLPGSKKSTRRVQWPNYQETIYRLLKMRHPEVLSELRPWLTRLSKKKRKELKLFFNKVFTLVGFQ